MAYAAQAVRINQSMEERGTDALRTHLTSCQQMDIRQTRRGYCMECFCPCEARSEFLYFVTNSSDVNIVGSSPVAGHRQVASSLEDSSCLCRYCCGSCHPFKMVVKEINTEAELLTVDRPFRCSAFNCKCCCYQTARISSGGQHLGTVKETFYCCVPSFKIMATKSIGGGKKEEPLYTMHPPTCAGGLCVDCFTEGNPCFGRGCCKVPFHIFPASAQNTNNGAPHIGKILKQPKSLAVELITDANSFLVDFPKDTNTEQKAILVGTSILLNAVFFEGSEDTGGLLDLI